METKPQYIKRLRTEISEVGSEIEKQIVRLNKLSVEIKQGYEELETPLEDKQALAQAKISESLMSGDEVWHFVWDNVWDAVKEYKLKAAPEIQQNFKGLESALQAKQSQLQAQLQVLKMSGDEVWYSVWSVVWNVVWRVIEEFNRKAAIKVKQVGEELQPLLDKQAALQSELHEALMSGDAFYNVLKGTINAMMKGTSS
jgi:DNA repair exonuclease SbcCD ATPase subunit